MCLNTIQLVVWLAMYSIISMLLLSNHVTTSSTMTEYDYYDKPWFVYLSYHIQSTFAGPHSAISLQLYETVNVFNQLHTWCHVDKGQHTLRHRKISHRSMSRMNLATHVPCGKIEVVGLLSNSTSNWIIHVPRIFGIHMFFFVFEMDDSGRSCRNTVLQIYEHLENQWQSKSRWRFCGNRLPSAEVSKSNRVVLHVTQKNVLKLFNLTLQYQIYSQYIIAHLDVFKSYFDGINLTPYSTYGLTFDYITIPKVQHWDILVNYGENIRIQNISYCCFMGTIILYEGPENYYNLSTIEISSDANYSGLDISIQTRYFNAIMVLRHDELTPNKFNKSITVFVLQFSKGPINKKVVPLNSIVTIANGLTILHQTFSINSDNGVFPTVSFVKVCYS